MSLITVINPETGKCEVIESNDSEQAHAVDAFGVSLGFVPLGKGTRTPEPPPGAGWCWSFADKQWQHTPNPADLVLAQIAALEASVTPRRLRDALIGGDKTFVMVIDGQIAALRKQLQPTEKT